MSLQNILLKIASDFGLNIENDETKNLVIHKINEAAEELYSAEDLVGSLAEDYFDVSEQDNTILTFPTFIGKIRAVVDNNDDIISANIAFETLWNQYNDEEWFKDRLLRWREVDAEHPLAQPMEDISHLTFKLRHIENVDITIRVSGPTDLSENDEETLTIPAGTRSVTTSRPFIDVENIEKTEYTLYDIDILDNDDNVLGTVHNCYRNPMYLVLAVQDERLESTYMPNVIRVLYKKRWKPFVRLADRFPADGYDDAIVYAFIQKYYGGDEAKQGLVDLAVAKENQLRRRLKVDYSSGKRSRITYDDSITRAVAGLRMSTH